MSDPDLPGPEEISSLISYLQAAAQMRQNAQKSGDPKLMATTEAWLQAQTGLLGILKRNPAEHQAITAALLALYRATCAHMDMTLAAQLGPIEEKINFLAERTNDLHHHLVIAPTSAPGQPPPD